MENQSFKINRGYADGKSLRAEQAEASGLMTARNAYHAAVASLRAFSPDKAESIEETARAWGLAAVLPVIERYLLDRVEYHHTGESFEKTNYYRVTSDLSRVNWTRFDEDILEAVEEASEALSSKAGKLILTDGARQSVCVTPGAYQVLRVDSARIRLCASVLDGRGVKHILPVFWRRNKTLKTGDTISVTGDPESARMIKSRGSEITRVNLYLSKVIFGAWYSGKRSQERYQECCDRARDAWNEALESTGVAPWGFFDDAFDAFDKAFVEAFDGLKKD